MRKLLLAAFLAGSIAQAGLISDVRKAAGAGDYAAADKLVEAYTAGQGVNPELALAVSWIGREALRNEDYETAERYAGEARELSLKQLEGRELDDEKRLPTALGATIEVAAQVMAARNELSEAVAFLEDELERWQGTSMRARIQKNLHLLSLEGKPAPPLELSSFIGPQPPSLASLKGKVVLLFFWAHWCSDCKFEAPVLARLEQEYGDKGLVVLGPTKLYGFARRGAEATPAEERAYIEQVRAEQYGAVANMATPLGEENFDRYGSSTTPTLVLIDREGIVRLYHPGEMPYEELEPLVRPLF